MKYILLILVILISCSETEKTDTENVKIVKVDSILVPIDYSNKNSKKFYLRYEFAKEYDPSKPTVITLNDAQQYWLRPGKMEWVQNWILNDNFNVLGVIHRGYSNVVNNESKNKDGSVNWEKAYQYFRYEQWVEDIESVRKHIFRDKKITLYGRSGGAQLLLEYLLKYGNNIERAFCQTGGFSEINLKLGILSDKFWVEIHENDKTLRKKIKAVLKKNPDKHDDIMISLQRQNFFVSADKIQEARKEYIEKLYNSDFNYFKEKNKEYQVDAIKNMAKEDRDISSSVRIFEFLAPLLKQINFKGERLYPSLESIAIQSKGLVNLYFEKKISFNKPNFANARKIETQLFLIGGRFDHTVDYRGQIYLDGLFPNSYLFNADDNHTLRRIKENKRYKELIDRVLRLDHKSKEFSNFMISMDEFKWSEYH